MKMVTKMFVVVLAMNIMMTHTPQAVSDEDTSRNDTSTNDDDDDVDAVHDGLEHDENGVRQLYATPRRKGRLEEVCFDQLAYPRIRYEDMSDPPHRAKKGSGYYDLTDADQSSSLHHQVCLAPMQPCSVQP